MGGGMEDGDRCATERIQWIECNRKGTMDRVQRNGYNGLSATEWVQWIECNGRGTMGRVQRNGYNG